MSPSSTCVQIVVASAILILLTSAGGIESRLEESVYAEGEITGKEQAGIPDDVANTGRRLKKLRRVALPLLLILLVKSGLAMPLLLVTLAAFKGLWTGSSALAVTAALALRHLIPPPRVIVSPHHHYTDYPADYRRVDDYRDDYNKYPASWRR